MYSHKSLLLNNSSVWIKRHNDTDFHVTMGSFDGAEICDPAGLYITNVLCDKYKKERVDLYRDGSLAWSAKNKKQ